MYSVLSPGCNTLVHYCVVCILQNIEIWKVKRLIKALEAARGNGTSMISLILPPKDQVGR